MVPFRNILVPLDGSELAEKSLLPAGQIATAMSRRDDGDRPTRLILLRVVSPVAILAADPYLYDEMMRMNSDEAQAYLNATAATLSTVTATIETKAVIGSPAEAIVQFAEGNNVDLIVMSSHGRTGSRRWVYGSVAEKVMHHAPCATAIIRAHVEVAVFQNRKILVPLDGSELAERALVPALALASAVDSDVWLLRVVTSWGPVPTSLTPDGIQLQRVLDDEREREHDEAEAYLQRVVSLHDNQRLFFDVRDAGSDVADEIITYADTQGVDLIVMSSHGRSGIGRWLHGSVAEKVLRGAGCATVIVRGLVK